MSVLVRLPGATRRRLGLAIWRLRHRRVDFGARCDVRAPFRAFVDSGARASFGAECVLDHGMVLEVRGRLSVGERTVFGHHCTLAAEDKVVIGRDCLIAEMVSIRDHDHEWRRSDVVVRDQGSVSAPVVIGDNVWIGSHVIITRGVRIGSGAVIGAGAVVTKDVPAGMMALGVPAVVRGPAR